MKNQSLQQFDQGTESPKGVCLGFALMFLGLLAALGGALATLIEAAR